MPAPRELEEVAVRAARLGGDVLLRYFTDPDVADRVVPERKARNDLVSAADRESEDTILAELFRAIPGSRALAEEGGLRWAADGDDSDSGGSGGTGEGESLAEDGRGIEWIVDPLDGTTNFLEGLPIWSVSIAAREIVGGHPGRLLAGVVFEPLADRMFSGALGQGIRRDGRDVGPLEDPPLGDAFLATGFPFRAHQAIDPYLACFRDVFLSVRAIRRCGSAALDLAYVACGIFDGFFEFRLSAWDIAAGALLIGESGGLVTDLDGGTGSLDSGNIVAGRPGIQKAVLAIVRRHVSEADLDESVARP